MKSYWIIALIGLAMVSGAGAEEEQATADLATAAQNPRASMISLPFQNNTTFGDMGGDYHNVLNVQPVDPGSLSKDWTLITRTVFLSSLRLLPATNNGAWATPHSRAGLLRLKPSMTGRWVQDLCSKCRRPPAPHSGMINGAAEYLLLAYG
jgi:hypothetical protein